MSGNGNGNGNGNNNDNNGDGNNPRRTPLTGMNLLKDLISRGPAPESPAVPLDISMSESAVYHAALHELSGYFNGIANPANPGLQKLREDWRYKLLESVWRDDLGRYMSLMATASQPALTRRWYWHFPNKPRDVSFLAPAHVVRTHLMAVAISRHKADFNAPDSEGRLPLYYIARYGIDPWLIPYLASAHKVDLRNSGNAANEMSLPMPKGGRYEEPLLRAIRYANSAMVEGFIQCAPHGFDLNQSRLPLGQTPLMIAVQRANKAAANFGGHGPGRLELQNRLAIVRELVAETSVDLDTHDVAGNTALDYALENAVRGAWDAGLLLRGKNQNRFRPPTDGPAP